MLYGLALLGASVAAPAPSRPPPLPSHRGSVAARPLSPADRFGSLFAAVQMRRIFADGKIFADAVPRRPVAAILTDYRRHRFDDAGLRRFVLVNFTIPTEPAAVPAPRALSVPRPSMRTHIAALWPVLTRRSAVVPAGGSLLALPRPYVVPGGRFREIYYWDSYFTMLGLARDGHGNLVEGMIDDFASLIERYGHVPNGTRTYYLSRSQPPLFAAMVALSHATNPAVRQRRLRAMRAEHAYWMAGAAGLRAGHAWRRVVALPDGAILNRYWDDRDTPRDESWREDVMTARAAGRPAPAVYRDLRAAAESGWDFSSRWLGDGRTLATVRTTAIVPVDLNSLLYRLEVTIADSCRATGDVACTRRFTTTAAVRKAAIARYLWDARDGRFADYDRVRGRRTDVVSAATLYPLFVGLATPAQAKAVAATVARDLVAPGGLRTTRTATGQQWDRPNGWAPLIWIAVAGLRRYGAPALAARIAHGWLATVAREYAASGRMLEKYNVETARPGGGGEYPLQDGFGWTNGVTRELLALYGAPSG